MKTFTQAPDRIEEYRKRRELKLSFLPRLYAAGCPDRAAARILGISPPLIARWRREHHLPILESSFKYLGTQRNWEMDNPEIVAEIKEVLKDV